MVESSKLTVPAAGDRARLLISCPDGPGIVAAVSDFLFRRGANIIHSSQHSTAPSAVAFLCEWSSISPDSRMKVQR